MEWSTDTSECKHGKQYLVYYDGNTPSYSLQVYMKYGDYDTKFTGEGFYIMDSNLDYWKRSFKQPTHYRELDTPNI